MSLNRMIHVKMIQVKLELVLTQEGKVCEKARFKLGPTAMVGGKKQETKVHCNYTPNIHKIYAYITCKKLNLASCNHLH